MDNRLLNCFVHSPAPSPSVRYPKRKLLHRQRQPREIRNFLPAPTSPTAIHPPTPNFGAGFWGLDLNLIRKPHILFVGAAYRATSFQVRFVNARRGRRGGQLKKPSVATCHNERNAFEGEKVGGFSRILAKVRGVRFLQSSGRYRSHFGFFFFLNNQKKFFFF